MGQLGAISFCWDVERMSSLLGALIGVGVGVAATGAAVYYRVMNPAIMTVGNGPIRIACVGDSITYGMGVLERRAQCPILGA